MGVGVLLSVGDARSQACQLHRLHGAPWGSVCPASAKGVAAVCLCASALCTSTVSPCGMPCVLRELANKFYGFCCCHCRLQQSVPMPADPAKSCLNGWLWWGEASSHCKGRAGQSREGAAALWQLCACLYPLSLVLSTPARGHIFLQFWLQHRPLVLCHSQRQVKPGTSVLPL